MMDAYQLHDAEVVGHYDAIETPFMAENIGQEMAVAVVRNAVQFVVGGHHRLHVGLCDRVIERPQEIFLNDAFGIIARSDVGAALRLSVDSEMLCGSEDVGLIEVWAVALEPADGCDTDASDEVRVFAVGFFRATPSRITSQIENWSEAAIGASRTCLGGGGGQDFRHQSRVPGRGQSDGLWV